MAEFVGDGVNVCRDEVGASTSSFSRILAGDEPNPGRLRQAAEADLNPPADGEAERETEFGGRLKVESTGSFG